VNKSIIYIWFVLCAFATAGLVPASSSEHQMLYQLDVVEIFLSDASPHVDDQDDVLPASAPLYGQFVSASEALPLTPLLPAFARGSVFLIRAPPVLPSFHPTVLQLS